MEDSKMYSASIKPNHNKNNNEKRLNKEHKDRSHIMILPGTPEMYKCNVCEKIFRNKKGKCYHDACITGIRPYRCNYCELSFVKRSHFEYHERVHTGYRPFKCSLCDKAFPQKNKLNRHMTSHKHEKEFCCGKCGKCYSKKDDLSNHMSLHTGIRPHVCKLCGKSFRVLTNLNRHARTHSNERPYGCEYCGKSFKDSSLLIRHTKIHGKERPFSCANCSRAFLSKSELARHLVIHTDVKPFSCIYCSTIFRRKDNLARHIRHHHNNETSGKPNEKTKKINELPIIINNDDDDDDVDDDDVGGNGDDSIEREQTAANVQPLSSMPTLLPIPKNNRSKKSSKILKPMKSMPKYSGPAIARIAAGNSRDQINSRMDSLGNITPIIRGPGEFSNAVPVINGPIVAAKSVLFIDDENGIPKRKKTYTYTEPIPLAEAVVINRRIEEKLYPQQNSIAGLANNYYFFRKMSSDLVVTMSNNNRVAEPPAPAPLLLPSSSELNYSVPAITSMSRVITSTAEISCERNVSRYSRSNPPLTRNSPIKRNYSDIRETKHSNGKCDIGFDSDKLTNRSLEIHSDNDVNNTESANLRLETINTHHWRRRTAETLKSSHPISG